MDAMSTWDDESRASNPPAEKRDTDDADKLRALREAARIGFDALDRGNYLEFKSVADLADYLRRIPVEDSEDL